jgi:hypothetical protein
MRDTLLLSGPCPPRQPVEYLKLHTHPVWTGHVSINRAGLIFYSSGGWVMV